MKKKKKNKKKVIYTFIGVIFVFLLIFQVSGFVEKKHGEDLLLQEASTEGEEYEKEEDISFLTLYEKDYVYDHDIQNYLFIGTDISGNPEGSGEEYQGSMADFLALLVIDRTDKSYGILHLNRETMTEISMLLEDDTEGQSEVMQLCTAHWYGSSPEISCENTVDAVSWMLGGLDIQGYYSIPMQAIPMINGMVGGVTVTVEDDFSRCDPTLKMGETITLNDEQAMNYVRGRMNVGDGLNRSRMKRQKTYLNALSNKVKERSEEEPDFSLKIYEQLQDMATTNINGNQISKIINRLFKYDNKGNFEFEGTTKTGKTLGDKEEHDMFYPDEKSVLDILTTLYNLKEFE